GSCFARRLRAWCPRSCSRGRTSCRARLRERLARVRGGALLVGLERSLLDELFLGGGEEVPELLVAAGGAHPGPTEAVAKLLGAMALAGVTAADADRGIGGLGERHGLGAG